MLGATKLLHRINPPASHSDPAITALKEELRVERKRADSLMNENLQLRSKLAEEVRCLKTKLATEKQMYSVLRKSFTMKTVEECWRGMSPELPDFEANLRCEIKKLERRAINLEAENTATTTKNQALAIELEEMKDQRVKGRQTRSAIETEAVKAQLEEVCKYLESICDENKHLKAQIKARESSLQAVIDKLKSEHEGLCTELASYSDLMRSERHKFEVKLSDLSEWNLKLSHDLDDANAKVRQYCKVEVELRNLLIEEESNYAELKSQCKALKYQLKNKDRSIERLESEITKEAEDEFLASEALKRSKKENIQLKNELRTIKANYEATDGSLEDLRNQLSLATKEVRMQKKDLATKAEEIQCLMEELDISRETVKGLKEALARHKEDYSRQYGERIRTLQNEKRELEERMKDYHDETSDTKSLFEHTSLHDELAQLDDYKPVGNLFNSFGDTNKVEMLKAELAEKETLIEALTKSRDELQANNDKLNKQLIKAMRQLTDLEQSKEIEVGRYRVLVRELETQKSCTDATELHVKIVDLHAEIDNLNKELLANQLANADETKKLKVALRDAEFKLGEARMQYYEAIKELKELKQLKFEETQTKGAMTRLSSIFKRT